MELIYMLQEFQIQDRQERLIPFIFLLRITVLLTQAQNIILLHLKPRMTQLIMYSNLLFLLFIKDIIRQLKYLIVMKRGNL